VTPAEPLKIRLCRDPRWCGAIRPAYRWATGRAQTGHVGFDIDRLVRLWNGPLPPGDEAALADFRAVYTDPITLNGAAVAVRARRHGAHNAEVA
jgi:hypothetical protein